MGNAKLFSILSNKIGVLPIYTISFHVEKMADRLMVILFVE